MRCDDLSRVNIDQLEQAFVRLTEALVAADNELTFASYGVTIELHGQPQGLGTTDYLASFASLPNNEELGPSLGSGALFYFGERPPVTTSNLAVDLSGVIEGKLYIRVSNVLDGTVLGPSDIRGVITERLRAGLESIGLRAGQG